MTVVATISTAVTAVFTIALVWVTYRLVLATDRLAEESARLREPQLIGRLEPAGPVSMEFVVSNIGGGAAKNVQLQLTLGTNVSNWRHVVFEPNRTDRFSLPGPHHPVVHYADQGATLNVLLSYEDQRGVESRIETAFPFDTVRADWVLAGWQIRALRFVN